LRNVINAGRDAVDAAASGEPDVRAGRADEARVLFGARLPALLDELTDTLVA
jgi:hypothetical protein